MNWTAPKRPLDHTEEALITAVLDGDFPVGSTLPGERQLAQQLGVTRPTLREALRRLERDGWFTIRHGKPTVVNDYLQDGRLNVLGALVQHANHLPPNFVPNLLHVRRDLAPSYIAAALQNDPERVAALYQQAQTLPDTAQAFAAFDWHMHRELTIASGNPVYTLIMNGFSGFYEQMALRYFGPAANRARSRTFYAQMLDAAERRAVTEIRPLVTQMMTESITRWPQARTEE